MNEPIIIGIAGGTASGKSTLATKIKDIFGDDANIIAHDCYYKSLSNITKEERMQRNYDCPEAYETDLLIKQIQELKSGKTIKRPIYSYTERLRENETVTVKPTKIIIIEGILVLENQELIKLMNLKIFVDTDANVRLERLIKRDTKERGLDIEYIMSKYENTLKPMHDKYVEPSKKNADIILNGDSYSELEFNKIIDLIRSYK